MDKGYSLLRNQFDNKDTAFTTEERAKLGLTGLLPTRVETIEQQIARCETQWKALNTNMEKFVFLYHMQNSNETLYFRFLMTHLTETLPIVYTPTVGHACVAFSDIWRQWPKGMYLDMTMKGQLRSILDNWKNEVDIIVMTDGTRILGLGDIGINGHGIPVGKLALYTVGAGFDPKRVLPITLDLGTNNSPLSEHYLGTRAGHPAKEPYMEFLDEMTAAIKDKWPKSVLQFEDFSKNNAFELLGKYRDDMRTFNDDIQGTGCIAAATFFNACRASGTNPRDHTFVFLGAGAGGVGVADALAALLVGPDYTMEQARRHFWLVDSRGLVTTLDEDNLARNPHKRPYARTDVTKPIKTLEEVVKLSKATALMGLSTIPNSFTKEIVGMMAEHTKQPIIFALSNPTSKCEVLAQQAYDWTDGRVLYASGSPMPDVETKEGTKKPQWQCNNLYVFPGIGHGALLCQASKITDTMISAAARACAAFVSDEDVVKGILLPSLEDIRNISAHVAAAVMDVAFEEGHATTERPADMVAFVKANQWEVKY